MRRKIFLRYMIFFHPDYTVGLGISPNPALRLVGYTTGGELHPALKTDIFFFCRQYTQGACPCQEGFPFLFRMLPSNLAYPSNISS